jgi:hypothetical protein
MGANLENGPGLDHSYLPQSASTPLFESHWGNCVWHLLRLPGNMQTTQVKEQGES